MLGLVTDTAGKNPSSSFITHMRSLTRLTYLYIEYKDRRKNKITKGILITKKHINNAETRHNKKKK